MTRKSEGDETVLGDETNFFEIKTPAAWHKNTRKHPYAMKTSSHEGKHEITKYGIHSFTQIALAVDKQLTYRQDSAPDWLNKSSRQLVICIYRQITNKLTKG